jgi:hypothetical protein
LGFALKKSYTILNNLPVKIPDQRRLESPTNNKQQTTGKFTFPAGWHAFHRFDPVARKKGYETVKHSMELEESMKLQSRGWVVQRIGWFLLLGMILLSILGLFGSGVLSDKTVTSGRFEAQYQNFGRRDAEMEVRLMAQDGYIDSVSFVSSYLSGFRVESMVPAPVSQKNKGETIFYYFGDSGAKEIVFYLVPKKNGAVKGSLGVNDVRLELKHFIYP